MLKLADITVYSPDHRIQLIAEVKGKPGASPEWAAQMRRNLLAHSLIPPTPFFLIAAPDKLFLWSNGSESTDEKPPDFIVDAKSIIAPYISDTSIGPDNMTDSSLQLILTSWLSLLIDSNLTPESAGPDDKWLFESGLFNAIKNGSLETEAS